MKFPNLIDLPNFRDVPRLMQRLLDVPGDAVHSDFESLNLPNSNKILLLFIDSFGWSHFERYKDELPFFKRFVENGIAKKIYSQFPSTTAVHVTTLHTGLSVEQHGILEWQYFDSKVGELICPLLFSSKRDSVGRDNLLKEGYGGEDILPRSNFHESLSTHGVRSFAVIPKGYVRGGYSDFIFRDMERCGYSSLDEAFSYVDKAFSASDKAYCSFYYPDIDSIGHERGPFSNAQDALINEFFGCLEILLGRILSNHGDVSVMFIADHGQVQINPKETFFLNKEIPDLDKSFKIDKFGSPVLLGGSPRDVLLYVKEDRAAEVKAILNKRLDGIGEVFSLEELLKANLWKNPSKRFLENLPTLVILPYEGKSIWWHAPPSFKQDFKGHHGGLSKEEIEIPFLYFC